MSLGRQKSFCVYWRLSPGTEERRGREETAEWSARISVSRTQDRDQWSGENYQKSRPDRRMNLSIGIWINILDVPAGPSPNWFIFYPDKWLIVESVPVHSQVVQMEEYLYPSVLTDDIFYPPPLISDHLADATLRAGAGRVTNLG